MIADLMESIKTITADYVAKLPAEKFIMKISVAEYLPIFRINSCYAYKVFSQDKCVQVLYSIAGSESIGVTDSSLAWCVSDTKDCTESEFLELYEKTLLTIKQQAK